MQPSSDNETWIVEVGATIIEKRADTGYESLSTKEKLIYWLWWTDYMLRNGGDFANAVALDRDFQSAAAALADSLGLTFTKATFSLSRNDLERDYVSRFDRICDEIRNA